MNYVTQANKLEQVVSKKRRIMKVLNGRIKKLKLARTEAFYKELNGKVSRETLLFACEAAGISTKQALKIADAIS